MTACLQPREIDFRRLLVDVTDDWSRREEPDTIILLREATQAYTGSAPRETDGALELLQRLERVGLLTPNAVHLLTDLSDVLGCEGAKQLVRNYLEKHPPAATGSASDTPRPRSAPAALPNRNKVSRKPKVHMSADQFTSDFEHMSLGYEPFGDETSSFERLGWSSSVPSESNPEEALAMPDSRDSLTSESVWRTTSWSELGGSSVSGGSSWPPLESVETAESRQRSVALWGRGAPSPQPAVCECYLPHVPPVAPHSRRSRRLTASVEQVLDLRPTTATSSASGSSSSRRNAGAGATRGHMPTVTPSGARRARLVDFLSQRLGARYLQLGEQLVSATELANITRDTSSGLVNSARRVLHLYLSRHRKEDGDVELALVRRLRNIRFNRLADELELWSAEQDEAEDPRDWPEDRRRWWEERRRRRPGRHHSPVHIPRMACC